MNMQKTSKRVMKQEKQTDIFCDSILMITEWICHVMITNVTFRIHHAKGFHLKCSFHSTEFVKLKSMFRGPSTSDIRNEASLTHFTMVSRLILLTL